MPPASRGLCSLSSSLRNRSCIRTSRRSVSNKPHTPPPPPPLLPRRQDVRNLPSRMRTRMKPPLEAKQAEIAQPLGSSLSERIIPQWTRNPRIKPYITMLSSFLISFPILGFLIMHIPIEVKRIRGPSMRPTINPNCESEDDIAHDSTFAIVTKLSPNRPRAISAATRDSGFTYKGVYDRGELVVCTTPHEPHKIAVKRIVAIAGDRVKPMSGYGGQIDPELVVVPYNHVWIEGDVNDRTKSLDSNYFGPISQEMICGKVALLWPAWWDIFNARRDWGQYGWPAREQKRVEENAVQSAQIDPQKVAQSETIFTSERGERILSMIEQHPELMKNNFETNDKLRNQYRQFWRQACTTGAGHQDAEIRARALQLASEMERLLGRDILASNIKVNASAERTRWQPQNEQERQLALANDAVVHEHELAMQRADRERPAAAALRDIQRKTREMREQKEREMEEKDKRDELRELESSLDIRSV